MKKFFKYTSCILITVLLFACSEDNFDVDLYQDYNHKTYDKVAFLCAHNAFSSSAHFVQGLFKNQEISIPDQLDFGVRSLMLDIYYKSNYSGADKIFLCHGGDCANNGGLRDEATPRALVHYLGLIKTFMDENPEAIITIILQDEVPLEHAGLVWQQFKDAGLDELYFHPDGDSWNVNDEGGWPTLQWMIDNDKRFIVFTSKSDHPNFPRQWDYTVENDYGSVDFNECPKREESVDLDDQDKHLFVMNHFRSLLLGVNATEDNNYYKLLNKVDNSCRMVSNRYPNFIAVDFVEQGKNGGVLKVVNELNQREDW